MELMIVVVMAMVFGASGYVFGRKRAERASNQLVDTIRQIDSERSLGTVAPSRTAEGAAMSREFNAMVERLDRNYRSRLDELLRERSKTDAIIESVEDGLIVLDNTQA